MSHQNGSVTAEEFLKIRSERLIERRLKAEATRQHQLQRIRDMKSRSGIHPLDRFPKEIWEKILESVGPKDLGNIMEVHDMFHELLASRRISDILLPEVLHFKFVPLWKRGLDPDDDDHFRSEDAVEEKALALGRFIRLREVSKALRIAIDQWYENEIIRNLLSENEAKITSFAFSFPGGERKLNRVLANFGSGSNKAQRFFLRSLKVEIKVFSVMEKDTFTQFKGRIASLLKLIGDQIWRLKYITERDYLEEVDGDEVSQVYTTLREWTELMPNLKWLVLNNKCVDNIMFWMEVPKNTYVKFPFPRVESLVRICCILDSDNYINGIALLSAVLKSNPHIKALNIIIGNDEDEDKAFFNGYLNPLLKSLPLALDVFSINVPDYRELCYFRNVQPGINFSWQLRRLSLPSNTFRSNVRTVFQLLENFQTLENLTLCLTHDFKKDISFLKLPNLTYLDLKMKYQQCAIELVPATNFFFSLQFLLYAKKLKKLFWKFEAINSETWKLRRFLVNHECSEKSINFRAGLRDLRSSNLWDLFPSLENFHVEIKEYLCDEIRPLCVRKSVKMYHRSEKF